MITKENKLENICSFYASDYHLEMIMIPYINRKIGDDSKIIIMTQRDLSQTIETVVSRVNFSQERRQEILNINWENNDIDKIKQIQKTNKNQEVIVFVIGNLDYIEDSNKSIREQLPDTKAIIIDCYSIEEAHENMIEILSKHAKVLNTTEVKELDENY